MDRKYYLAKIEAGTFGAKGSNVDVAEIISITFDRMVEFVEGLRHWQFSRRRGRSGGIRRRVRPGEGSRG